MAFRWMLQFTRRPPQRPSASSYFYSKPHSAASSPSRKTTPPPKSVPRGSSPPKTPLPHRALPTSPPVPTTTPPPMKLPHERKSMSDPPKTTFGGSEKQNQIDALESRLRHHLESESAWRSSILGSPSHIAHGIPPLRYATRSSLDLLRMGLEMVETCAAGTRPQPHPCGASPKAEEARRLLRKIRQPGSFFIRKALRRIEAEYARSQFSKCQPTTVKELLDLPPLSEAGFQTMQRDVETSLQTRSAETPPPSHLEGWASSPFSASAAPQP